MPSVQRGRSSSQLSAGGVRLTLTASWCRIQVARLLVITYITSRMGFNVEIYVTQYGRQPFVEWFETLRDVRTQARIEARLRRLSLGLLGDHRTIGGGLMEMRLDFGPGFRIYFARVTTADLLLLSGGDKGTQQRDIQRAISYLTDYKERSR